MSDERYTEIEADPGDAEGRILETLASGMPYAFVVATSIEPLNLRVASGHGIETIRSLLGHTLRVLPGGPGNISDGDHTFTELYAHRRALTAALCKALGLDAWRSIAHHPENDAMFPGYFIVGINLPTGTVTYHYELEHWDDFAGVPELEHAPRWDGALPDDTVKRLLGWVRG